MGEKSAFQKAKAVANAEIKRLRKSGELQRACDSLAIPPDPPGQFWAVNRAAILWLRVLKANGGIDLNPKYWHLDRNAVEVFSAAVEQALISGSDAYKAAASFMYNGPGNEVVRSQQYPGDYDFVDKAFLGIINAAHRGSNM